MMIDSSTHSVESIGCRRVLNSHLGFTNEFVMTMDDGRTGVGASPQGETIGVYEDRWTRGDARNVVEEIRQDRLLNEEITQSDFDRFLEKHVKEFGRNNCWALSLAFFNAARSSAIDAWLVRQDRAGSFPRICLNILNGGRHAYTNPVLSDFPEYLVVPRFDDANKVLKDHAAMQDAVKERLASCERVTVNGNAVHRFGSDDNRGCLAFLQGVLDGLGLSHDYDLMIDASAGDLWAEERYEFPVSDRTTRSSDELQEYWNDLIDEFQIGFLEDPLREHDHEAWTALAAGQSKCRIIGDNFYSSDAERIEKGARDGCTHGAIIKPNQAGTVSAVMRAVEVSHGLGQIAITSHRSISTESTFLSLLTVMVGVRYIKIGPLYTDYSSVMRLNELIRLTGVELD